jgi:hypothetical protein
MSERMGMVEDAGFMLVPVTSFISNSAAGFDGIAMPLIPAV